MRRLLLLTLAGLGALGALGAGSVAASASAPPPPPVWNNGYGWWPPGFGYPPLTVRVPGYTCTVTAAGPTFHSYPREWRQDFGGSVRCPSTLGTRSLTVSLEVLGPQGKRWFTVSGTPVTYGPNRLNPLRIVRNRPAYLGHVYRTVARATLVLPNGHAGCSLSHTCMQTVTVTVRSRRLAP